MLNRRQFIGTSALAVAGSALLRVPLIAQRGGQAPATRFEELRRGVGVFIGQGGAIGWLATPDGAVAVDSQYPNTAEAAVKGLQTRSAGGLQLLINTHHHGDHTAGNVVFRPLVRSIVAHEQCAALHRQMAQGQQGQQAQAQAFPDVTFTDSWSTSIGNERITATHYGRGHTSGDAVIHFENADVVHMGDLMFNRIHPFVDTASGASMRNWITTLDTVAKKHSNAMYIFGHGKDDAVTGTAKDVTYFRDYLTAALNHVQAGVKAGRSQEEITALETLPGFPDHVSPIPLLSLNGVLAAAYQEVAGSR
jgi:cyclase